MKFLFIFTVILFSCDVLCKADRHPSQCPINWGSDLKKCDLRLCDPDKTNASCPAEDNNSEPGFCCHTRCGGRNCYYPPRSLQELHTCPLNWIASYGECDLDTCNLSDSNSCRQNGNVGICCRTACGGHNCYYPSKVRKVRNSILSVAFTCPIGDWMGVYPKRCNEVLCSGHSDCNLNGFEGQCCNTSCGGTSCIFSPKSPRSVSCPVPWNGHSNITCGVTLCLSHTTCGKNTQQGFCCPTSCKGYNCYYPSKKQELNCPRHWPGINPVMCASQLCTHSVGCSENGRSGHCCSTICGGQNCFYNTTNVSTGLVSTSTTPKQPITFRQIDFNLLQLNPPPPPLTSAIQRINEYCPKPHLWSGWGAHCSKTQCFLGTSCNNIDLPGLCCSTMCGGANCFVPDLFLHKTAYCPFRWIGLIGNCGHKMCSRNSDCQKRGKVGYCCRTVCGGKNCHYY